MNHFGNDVLYFDSQDQIRIYSQVKEIIFSRLTSSPDGIRMYPYVRLVIEPMFAYNNFDQEEDV
jgi:hypothetical protein